MFRKYFALRHVTLNPEIVPNFVVNKYYTLLRNDYNNHSSNFENMGVVSNSVIGSHIRKNRRPRYEQTSIKDGQWMGKA